MKISIKQRTDKRNYLLKTVLSFITAYLMVDEGKALTFDSLKANFGWPLLINFLMIYLLIYIVSFLTATLDHYYPWHKNYIKRIGYQFLIGILTPLLLAIAAVTFYYSFRGIVIWDITFFEMYLQRLLMALVGINFYLFYQDKQKNLKAD